MYDIPVPGLYRHFKGTLYEVLFTARHSETSEELVIYRAADGHGPVWARPLSMWGEEVERGAYRGPRFAPAGEEARL